MIPQISEEFLGLLEEPVHSSYTYKMDLSNQRISGYTDGQEAMKQAIYKRLQTPRERYSVYSPSYGLQYEDFFGMPLDWVAAVLPERIREALSYDDRIQTVEDISVSTPRTGVIYATFTVHTDFGEFTVDNLEVNANV